MSIRILRVAVLVAVAVALTSVLPALAQEGVTVQKGAVTSFTPASNTMTLEDMANARPMPMPRSPAPAPGFAEGAIAPRTGTPGFEPGSSGDGTMSPSFVPMSRYEEPDVPQPEEFGTANFPYTTSRVDVSGNAPSKFYPYRAAGKLYFKISGASYVCSASLIKRGVIVTAAHCVTAFGGAWYSDWVFVPAKYDLLAPYGSWKGDVAWVMSSYKGGTDPCYAAGVVCQNDVALVILRKKLPNRYPGTQTGWFGYGWDGYGFTGENQALINQLGYPVSHDSGNRMQRNDGQGYVNATYSNNTVWGTRMTGGSSGGPELVNLGMPAVLSGTAYGSEPAYNIVVGVTSWGWTDLTVKQQGASSFTSGNITVLVSAACATGATTFCKP